MKRKISFMIAILTLFFACNITVFAESTNYNVDTPYYSYTYNSAKEAMQTPAPYTVSQVIRGNDLGITNFTSLKDVFYDKESERVFLTDSGANAIIVLDQDYQFIRLIDSFDNQGNVEGFNSPGSVCVRNDKLYVADTGNSRILCFDSNSFELLKVLDKPEISILGGNYSYKPMRMAIDLAGRIYVIAKDINEGIILLDANGEFLRFAGAPDVQTTLWTKFLKLFMTKAQKANLEKAVPTEYSSMVMDEKGFLYLTSSDSTVHPITKLNSQGTDILRYEDDDYPDGDSSYPLKTMISLKSTFVDIAVRDDDIYASIDTLKGRIFIYDQEGTLLYVFGGIGVQDGTFYSPSAIEFFDDTILVTDSFYGTVTVLKRTEFGTAVEVATDYMLEGKYEESGVYWNEVLRLCPTYDSANINLARVDLQNKEYKKALKRLEGTTDLSYYSKAQEGIREKIIEDNFTLIVISILVIFILWVTRRFWSKRIKLKERLMKYRLIREIQYSNYTMFHPFDGFWDLKHEKRGSIAAANVLVFMFVVVHAIRVQFGGYIFTGVMPSEVNTLFEIVKIITPLGLWCVANWCFTSLMDGKGTMKDIYIATAYSLRPYIITGIPLWLISRCLVEDEAFIYTTLSTIVIIWMLALIFFSMMITHDYSLSKAVVVTILTLLGICLILFLALTFSNIVQRIYDFAMDLYREFIYRTY